MPNDDLSRNKIVTIPLDISLKVLESKGGDDDDQVIGESVLLGSLGEKKTSFEGVLEYIF